MVKILENSQIIKNSKPGVCPVCSNKYLDYERTNRNSKEIYKPYVCHNCDTVGEEYWEISPSREIG